ncbi:MAG: type II toxin-antitoxin system RatA family toxin [Bacillota bacterium]
MPKIRVSKWVAAPKAVVFPLAAAMEDYPKFMRNVKEVRIINREHNYAISAWKTEVDGRMFCWLEEDRFYPEQGQIDYKLISGDLKKFEGSWVIEDKDGGSLVSLTVDFELGVPALAPLLNPILSKKTKENCLAMLEGIAGYVNRL